MSDNPTIAQVGSSGLVTGVSEGAATVTATSESVSGHVTVTVTPPHVATVEVAPNAPAIEVGGSAQLVATLRDANGTELHGRSITWMSDNPTIAQVDAAGLVVGIAAGAATVTAMSESVSGDATVTVTAPAPQDSVATFATIAAGNGKTCALDDTGKAYCWGANDWGDLGDGTTIERNYPVPVATVLSFIQISAGGAAGQHACALTAALVAYCWGYNDHGQLGNGANVAESAPVPVSGGLLFTRIATARKHTCGLAPGGIAYCWGQNQSGQLGDGTTINRNVPGAVTGLVDLFDISAGGWWAPRDHACAIANGPGGGRRKAPK